MKKLIIALILIAGISSGEEQQASVRVQVVYTNETGREISKYVNLVGWSASWDGTNWTAIVEEAYFGSNSITIGDQKIDCTSVERTKLIGKQNCRTALGMDFNIKSTTYAPVNLPALSMTIDNPIECGLQIYVAACGAAGSGEDLSITVFLNGTNMLPGTAAAIYTDSESIVPLGQGFFYPILPAGRHTLTLSAKVSGGTAVLKGTKAPIQMIVTPMKGDL